MRLDEREAPVALQHRGEPARVADRDRVVETELMTEVGADLGRHVGVGRELLERVAWRKREHHEQDERDSEQARNRDNKTTQDVLTHERMIRLDARAQPSSGTSPADCRSGWPSPTAPAEASWHLLRPRDEALARGANIVITGRSTDTALTMAPLRHEFGWGADDWDKLAAGIIAGHIIECGAQCSGGNCLYDWQNIPDLANVGYPIVEGRRRRHVRRHQASEHRRTHLRPVGHRAAACTRWAIRTRTSRPTSSPTSRRSTLEQDGENRVRVFGIKGRPPTDKLKVSIAYRAGFKAVGTLVYSWPDALDEGAARRSRAARAARPARTQVRPHPDRVRRRRTRRTARSPASRTIRPRCSCASACAARTRRRSSASRARSRRSCSTVRRA